MVDDEVDRGAELREMAAKLRLLAGQTRSREARAALLDLAERFEARAAATDGREDPSEPA